MKKIIGPTLLFFVSLTFFVNLVAAQGNDCQIISTSKGGTSLDDWVDICEEDYKACEDQYAIKNKACYAIEDECNKNDCNHGLATLSFLPCDKCIEKAKPCYDAAQNENTQCFRDHNRRGKIIPLEFVDFSLSIVDSPPTQSEAARLNEELKTLFGDLRPELLQSQVPEITGPTPYIFKGGRYFSFASDQANNLVHYQSGNALTFHFPDGTAFSPQGGDFVRVPPGTRISADYSKMGVAGSDWKGWASVWIANTTVLGVNTNFNIEGGGEVVLTPVEQSGPRRVEIVKGALQVDVFGSDPQLPSEIQFEGRNDVKLTWDGTNFAVNYDPQTNQIAAEIYDGTIKIAVGDKKYELTSSYGQEIKRIEIDSDDQVVGKIAQAKIAPTTPPIEPIKKDAKQKPTALVVLIIIGVIGGAVGFWYRKAILTKLKEIVKT